MRLLSSHLVRGIRLRRAGVQIALALTLIVPSAGLVQGARAQENEFSIDVASAEELAGLTAVVAFSDDGVNLRAEPDLEADILDTLPDGTVVTLRVDETDTVLTDDGTRWWPVRFDGEEGWISGAYLADAEGAPASDGDEGDEETTSAAGEFVAGDYVAVESEDGLSMRSGPSVDEERLAALGDGDIVQIMDGPFLDDDGEAWYLVTDGDFSAYVFGTYLTASSSEDEDAAPDTDFGPGDSIAPEIGSGGVYVRSRASVNSRRLASINEGVAVEVLDVTIDKQGDVWYLITTGDVEGYMFGAFMVDSSSIPDAPASGPTGGFIYPVANYVFTQAYGCTIYNFEPWDANLGCPFHNGIDLAAPSYTPIMAADGGVVKYAGWCDCGLGYYVEIDHGNGFATVYGHMAEQPYVSTGQSVNQGDVIGPMGSTGFSTGPHVHFMIKLNGSTVDPLSYL